MAEQGTKIDVAQVASLARLSLPQDMIPRLQSEMEQIVGYVEMLADLDVSGIEPTAHAVARTNVLRDDVPSDPFPREALLANAPDLIEGELVKVPQVLPGEGIA